MGSGYFLIFLIIIVSVGLNVWLLTNRKDLKKEIEKYKLKEEESGKAK